MVANFVSHRIKVLAVIISFTLLVISLNSEIPPIRAQVSLSTTTPYTQNFDDLGTSATAALPPDWRVSRHDSNYRWVDPFAQGESNTQYVGGNSLGSSVSAGIYNFGAGNYDDATDRAVGFLASSNSTKSGNLFAHFNNGTGAPLSGVVISYNVEKYRKGTSSPGFRIQLYYSLDGTQESWTSAGSDFLTFFPNDTTNSGYADAPGVTVSVSNKTLGVVIPSGSDFYLAWNYSIPSGTSTSSAQALAVDDFSILGVPEDVLPNVDSTTPTDGAIAVPMDTTVTIGFSESVDLTASAVTLECPAGTPVTFGGLPTLDLSSVTLTPSSTLPAGTTCTGTVVADQVTDNDGTPDNMAVDYIWSFSTADNPVPTLTFISPNSARVGAIGFTLTLTGTSFVSDSVVRWDGASLTTTFVSSTELTAPIPASNLMRYGTFDVTVFNPSPGGGESNSVPIQIDPIRAHLPIVIRAASGPN